MSHINKNQPLNKRSQRIFRLINIRFMMQALLLIALAVLTTQLIQNKYLVFPKIHQSTPFILSFLPLLLGFFFQHFLGGI
jgi:hypothetical protein